MKKNKIIQKNKGAAMILVVFFFVFISLTILIGIVTPALREYKIANNNFVSKQAYFWAESGVEDILVRLKNSMVYDSTEEMVLGSFKAITEIQDLSSDSKEISSIGELNEFKRKVSTNVKAGIGVSFSYGVQVGQGGFIMDNNSVVDGSVYSNGTITGSGDITGSAMSANSSVLTSDQLNGAGTPAYDLSFGNNSATEDFAQSFQISETETINKIQLFLIKEGSPTNLTVRITTNSNGKPSTTTLASGSLSSSLVSSNNYGWVDVPFSSNPKLSAGTTYWFVIDGSTSSSKYYKIGANYDGYINGGSKIGKYGGTWKDNSPSLADSYFNLYIGGINGLIDGIDIGEDNNGIAHAHQVKNSTVAGILYCQTGSGNNKTCNTTRPDPVQIAMPISEQNILDWKEEALTGGEHFGNLTIDGTNISLGPKKINGNLIFTNGAIATITGTIWVTGSITVSNNAIVRLHPSYGSSDGAIIADGNISISNNASFSGSGASGSYIMVLTTSSTSEAINLGNNAGAVLLYAANGTINVSNNAGAKALTGYYIHLSNNAKIIYDSGLINSNFIGGPSGSWNFSSWKEIE